MPADAELSRHDPDVPDWDSLPPDRAGCYARMMEVFAGFLSHTDHHIGRLLDYLRETGELDNTLVMLVSDNGASAEGGATGTTERDAVLQQRARAAGGQPQGDRRARRPDAPSTTTRGAGPGPATRRSAGGSGRPTAAAPATRSSCTGPTASRPAARSAHQYAHIIDMVPTVLDALGIEPPATHPRRDPVTDPRRQLRAHLRRRRRRDAPPHPVLRDVRAPRHRPRRLAGGLPLARPLVRRGRQAVRHADHRRDARPTSTPTTGSSTTSPRIRREPRPRRPSTATSSSR